MSKLISSIPLELGIGKNGELFLVDEGGVKIGYGVTAEQVTDYLNGKLLSPAEGGVSVHSGEINKKEVLVFRRLHHRTAIFFVKDFEELAKK